MPKKNCSNVGLRLSELKFTHFVPFPEDLPCIHITMDDNKDIKNIGTCEAKVELIGPPPQQVPGVIGGALLFDTTNSLKITPADLIFSASFSVSFFVFDAIRQTGPFANIVHTGGRGWRINRHVTQEISTGLGSNTTGPNFGSAGAGVSKDLKRGRFTHVFAIFDRPHKSVQLFLDGKPQFLGKTQVSSNFFNSRAIENEFPDLDWDAMASNNEIFVATGSNNWEGAIDDLKIWQGVGESRVKNLISTNIFGLVCGCCDFGCHRPVSSLDVKICTYTNAAFNSNIFVPDNFSADPSLLPLSVTPGLVGDYNRNLIIERTHPVGQLGVGIILEPTEPPNPIISGFTLQQLRGGGNRLLNGPLYVVIQGSNDAITFKTLGEGPVKNFGDHNSPTEFHQQNDNLRWRDPLLFKNNTPYRYFKIWFPFGSFDNRRENLTTVTRVVFQALELLQKNPVPIALSFDLKNHPTLVELELDLLPRDVRLAEVELSSESGKPLKTLVDVFRGRLTPFFDIKHYFYQVSYNLPDTFIIDDFGIENPFP